MIKRSAKYHKEAEQQAEEKTGQLSIFGEKPFDWKDEWVGMPEFVSEDCRAYRSILLHFSNQADVDEFAELIKRKITLSTRYMWYRPQAIRVGIDRRYTDES